MIRRSILDDPDGVIADFDFFNDYADTMIWLRRCVESKAHPAPSSVLAWLKNVELIRDRLQAKYNEWITSHRKRRSP